MIKINTKRNIVINHEEGEDKFALHYRFPLNHERDYSKVRAMLQYPDDAELAKDYKPSKDSLVKLMNETIIESLVKVEGFVDNEGNEVVLDRDLKEILYDRFSKDSSIYDKILAAYNGESVKN